MFEELRTNRTIVKNSRVTSIDEQVTMFLGLFNAEAFLESLESQIRNQEKSCPLVVVDNSSTDLTWIKIQRWLETLDRPVTLARNPINLGGTGTLLANLDLVSSSWVITLHQDDFYLPNHVSTLQSAISEAGEKHLAFSTEMGSMDANGVETTSPPRASWLLGDSLPATMFLSNLRLHNFPFPASAFRVTSLETGSGPWHSNVFPDSEMVLNWAALGHLVHIPKITMRYRENPLSESHSVSTSEKQLGVYLPLTRIVNSSGFRALLESLDVAQRDQFFRFFSRSARDRINNKLLADLLIVQAAEVAGFTWSYSSSAVNAELARYADQVGAKRTQDLLMDLTRFYKKHIDQSESEIDLRAIGASHDFSDKKRSAQGLLALLSILPCSVRKPTFRALMKLYARLSPGSPWNSRWQR